MSPTAAVTATMLAPVAAFFVYVFWRAVRLRYYYLRWRRSLDAMPTELERFRDALALGIDEGGEIEEWDARLRRTFKRESDYRIEYEVACIADGIEPWR